MTALKDLREAASSGHDFVEGARLELFTDRIFVFSPKGDLYDLPEGATALDFAFAVHSEIGLRTLGAKVNSRLVTLDRRLENRDVVDIITRKQASPNRDWLSFVRTTTAKNRIKAWYRAASRSTNIASGRGALEPELRAWGYRRIEELPKSATAALLDGVSAKSWDDVSALIGEGTITVGQVLRRLFPSTSARQHADHRIVTRSTKTGRVLVEATRLPYTLAPCCNPVFPQSLIGYVTRGKGVTVHREGCRNLPSDVNRFASCQWELESEDGSSIVCELEVVALNRVGLLRDITSSVAKHGLSIVGLESENTDEDESVVRFKVEVTDLHELAALMHQLQKEPGIRHVANLST